MNEHDVPNPPAFPSHAGDPEMSDPRNQISCGGMTLRDWFAGQALAGLCANAEYLDLLPKASPASEKALAEVVTSIADAMLRNRIPNIDSLAAAGEGE